MTWILEKKGETKAADLIRQTLVLQEAKRTSKSDKLHYRIAEIQFE
jgi:hypothetical protein